MARCSRWVQGRFSRRLWAEVGGETGIAQRVEKLLWRGFGGDLRFPDANAGGVGVGEGVQGLRDATDAGTAVHIFDAEGENRHGYVMREGLGRSGKQRAACLQGAKR